MEKSYNEIPRKSSTYRTLGGKAFGLIRRAMDPELQFEFDEKKRREQYLSDLAAERQERLARPSFTTLLYNQQYKKWKSGADYSEPYGLELNYDHLDKGKAFELVEAGKLIPDHNVYESIQHHVDPNLSSDRLDQLCRDYCKRTSLTFLANATEIAESFASKGDKNITTTEKLAAIAKLVGTPQSEESTIFTDQSWYIADYKPDFKQLGVDLREIGVDYDKVISGISLCIGLWVQLADSNVFVAF